MPNIRATGGLGDISGTIDIQSKSEFTVASTTVGTTETSIVLPVGVKAYRIKTGKGNAAVLTISHVAAGTGAAATSWEITMGDKWVEEYLTGTSSITIYIKSSKAATPVQVLYWT